MWFEQLTGFAEQGAAQVWQMMSLENGVLTSRANGTKFKVGQLATPTVAKLMSEAAAMLPDGSAGVGSLKVQEVIADAQNLHVNPENAGAIFQVASQFNLLEMVSPTVTPDSGITGYQFDRTQGPACALACGAGLIYRNYFVSVDGVPGQTAERQLNMLDEFELQFLALVNKHNEQQFNSLWQMKNGYALPTAEQLSAINHTLAQLTLAEITQLTSMIKIGVQYDTEVTLKNTGHLVTQAYCSAMPVAYSQHSSAMWQPLASLILQSAYQATLAAAVINTSKTNNNRVYLTLLGGGAFGNSIEWIIEALQNTIHYYRYAPLDIRIVSYGRSNEKVKVMIQELNNDLVSC